MRDYGTVDRPIQNAGQPGRVAAMGFSGRTDRSAWSRKQGCSDVPGIVIAFGAGADATGPRVPALRAFVYGEKLPTSPTLPFGRWKQAS